MDIRPVFDLVGWDPRGIGLEGEAGHLLAVPCVQLDGALVVADRLIVVHGDHRDRRQLEDGLEACARGRQMVLGLDSVRDVSQPRGHDVGRGGDLDLEDALDTRVRSAVRLEPDARFRVGLTGIHRLEQPRAEAFGAIDARQQRGEGSTELDRWIPAGERPVGRIAIEDPEIDQRLAVIANSFENGPGVG